MPNAIDAIKAEHVNLARVLTVLEETVAGLSDHARSAELEDLYAIVHYIRVFPDKLHHPKEEKYIFTALRRRVPESSKLLAELEAQHAEGGRRIAELELALRAYEEDGAGYLATLQQVTRDYLAQQRRHMATEEREVLPLAAKCLEAGDWSGIDDAFATHSDPLFGENLATGFQALYRRIVEARR